MIDPAGKAILKLTMGIVVLITAGLWIYGRGEAASDAKHAQTLQRIAELTAKAAEKAHAARAAYGEAVASDLARFEQEKSDAYDRGHAVGADIAAGAVRVRDVWRDRECPAAAAGEGAGLTAGHPVIDPGRADAIGRILGYGWQWDATYGLAVGRLRHAQSLLDACYDQPAR